MHSTIEKNYQKITSHYNDLLKICENLSYEELNIPIAKDKWSVAQILTHITITIANSTSYLIKKIQSPENIPSINFSTGLRSALLNTALRSDFKFKAPKAVQFVPEYNSMEKIKEGWEEEKIRLFVLLDTFPPFLLKKAVFRHPAAGRITLDQALESLDLHLLHHKRQIIRFLDERKSL